MLYGENIWEDDPIPDECVAWVFRCHKWCCPWQYDFSEWLTKLVNFPYKKKERLPSIYIAAAFMENANCTKPCFKIVQKLGPMCLYVNGIKY